MFYLDLELPESSDIKMIAEALEKLTRNLEVLGVYNKDNMLYES
jgi:prephenate dehydratase